MFALRVCSTAVLSYELIIIVVIIIITSPPPLPSPSSSLPLTPLARAQSGRSRATIMSPTLDYHNVKHASFKVAVKFPPSLHAQATGSSSEVDLSMDRALRTAMETIETSSEAEDCMEAWTFLSLCASTLVIGHQAQKNHQTTSPALTEGAIAALVQSLANITAAPLSDLSAGTPGFSAAELRQDPSKLRCEHILTGLLLAVNHPALKDRATPFLNNLIRYCTLISIVQQYQRVSNQKATTVSMVTVGFPALNPKPLVSIQKQESAVVSRC